MKPDEPVTRTESGAMPRSGSQPTSDSVGRSGCGALKASCRQAPHKPALRVAFVPVTPPVVVPGQMPHVAYQNVRQKIAMANSHNPQSPEPVSHIHGLLESIAAAPARIAPERVDELKQTVGVEFNVTILDAIIEITDSVSEAAEGKAVRLVVVVYETIVTVER